MNRRQVAIVVLAGLLVLLTAFVAGATVSMMRTKGQTLYVPVYSHVLHGDRAQPFNLTATLSIRNADPGIPITVVSVDYYDSKGKLVRHYLKEPMTIAPMASTEFLVNESDTKGGLGASFLVKWESDKMVAAPVVEAVMIGTAAAQGISFVERARIVDE